MPNDSRFAAVRHAHSQCEGSCVRYSCAFASQLPPVLTDTQCHPKRKTNQPSTSGTNGPCRRRPKYCRRNNSTTVHGLCHIFEQAQICERASRKFLPKRTHSAYCVRKSVTFSSFMTSFIKLKLSSLDSPNLSQIEECFGSRSCQSTVLRDAARMKIDRREYQYPLRNASTTGGKGLHTHLLWKFCGPGII